jgi:hypothetical protein
MFEYVLRMTLLDGLLTYGITGLWIAFNWFYLNQKITKKQQQKLNDSRSLEHNQFKEEE